MITNTQSCPTRFDPLDTDIRRCPHPHYAALNNEVVQPVRDHPNFWLVSGFETVSEVLMDPHTYSGQPFPGTDIPIMSAMDPEPHKRLRSAIQMLFTTKALATLQPRIESQVRQRTQQLLRAGGGDLMTLWANPIPLSVISHMFGFPDTEEDLARLHRYGDAAIRLSIPLGGPGLPVPHGWRERARQAAGMARAVPSVARLLAKLPAADRRSLLAFPNPLEDRPGFPRTGFARAPQLAHLLIDFQIEVLDILRSHMREPGQAVVDALIPPYQRGELSLVEILTSALQILVAGYETTANTLASAVYRFTQQPEELDTLYNHPDRMESFIEELLRIDAPLQRTLRRTTRPAQLGGVDLPENSQLIVMLGAANVDAERFANPLAFNPDRPQLKRHLTFGRGIHMCIGAQLARLEARTALSEFVTHVRSVSLAGNPERIADKDIGMWGFSHLPVQLQGR